MALRNEPGRFGVLSRLFHWITAVVVFAAIGLGLWISEMQVSLSTLKYFGWHKTLGILALALMVARAIWHAISPTPSVIEHGTWRDGLARWVHRGFYACLIAMPLAGWFASSATGIDTVIFGALTLPRIAPVSESYETIGFAVHRALGYALYALIVLHVSGAAYRGLIVRDGTFSRMAGR